ncbi:hypothetical protein CASFOL_006665 [Castilleja foliolosa]|uniref:Protein EARLY FLOWERING 4 domain-containing protein n=1 Tax=Castilleja foliolosa TaxID=1961234 RepID=A0ABD3E7K9_9LAMI
MGDISSDNNLLTKTTSTPQAPHLLPEEEGDKIVGGDPVVWATFNNNLQLVQSMLDQNSILIQQVNENHKSNIHENMTTQHVNENQKSEIHENMMKNVSLIQEINRNINKVASLYSDMTANFSDAIHQKSTTDEVEVNSSDEHKK